MPARVRSVPGTRRARRTSAGAVTAALALSLFLSTGDAGAADWRGHAKLLASAADLPADSLLVDFADDPIVDSGLDLRLNLEDRRGAWRWHADYQLLALRGDSIGLRQDAPLAAGGAGKLPDDERRVFDLTDRIVDNEDRVAAQRLDRLYLSHTTGKTVVNVGRQAISWGNGLIYNPVDFFNPFDPAAIDTEYKTGDDMIYAQYLLDSGDDLQAVWVGRRDSGDAVSRRVSSLALKYHGFAISTEYDVLVAEHYDDRIVALGGSADAGDAIWRGDLLLTDTGDERVASAVLDWSYSWVAWQRNFSATVEYFRNGFGIDDGDYGPAALAANPALVERIGRGELFTLGRHYLAAATTVELDPLWLLTATLFVNLDDESALLQMFSRHDLEQDLQLLLALNLPAGAEGSEFGGIDSAVADRPLAIGASAFAQLAWYF